MNCEAYREALIADPGSNARELTEHAERCPACAAYTARVRAVEEKLGEALQFDTERLRERLEVAPSTAVPTNRGRWAAGLAGAVVGVVVSSLVWLLLAPGGEVSTVELAAAVVEHWYEEPEAWSDAITPVAATTLASALDGKVRIDLEGIGPVTYARSCLVAGEWVPHLVVQGESGPFMVLLLPERELATPLPLSLEAESLNGAVLPVGQGSIAVLGGDFLESATVGAAVAAAVEWTI